MNPKSSRYSHKPHLSAAGIAAYCRVVGVRECVNELGGEEEGLLDSTTTLARERLRGERMRQKEGADSQWMTSGKRDTDRFSGFSGFSLLHIFCVIFLSLCIPLSSIFLYRSSVSIFVLLSYIQT